ncbi:hypothetical protein ACTA71_000129 [Dictyostelium dimigraforme]
MEQITSTSTTVTASTEENNTSNINANNNDTNNNNTTTNNIDEASNMNKEKAIENGGLLKAYAEQGNLEKVKHLIEVEKISPDQPDLFGDSALHGASANGRITVIEYLLGKKSNPNIKNKVGSTPLHKAVTIDHNSIGLGVQMNLIRLLLKNGADPTIVNMAGLIPEQLATSIRVKEMLQGDQAVTILLPIPKVHHGKIIGRGGKNLKELREITNTQIQLPESNVTDNKITIKGRKDDVEKARQMILDIVNPPKTQEEIEAEEKKKKEEEEADIEILNLTSIAKEKHSLIIGAQGKNIKYLRSHFNVKISIPPTDSSENNISIQGKSEDIDNAMKYINEILKKNNEIKNNNRNNNNHHQNNQNNQNNNKNSSGNNNFSKPKSKIVK